LSLRRKSFQYTQAVARRARSVPLSTWVRTRSGMLPSETEYGMTADHLIDDPREPYVMPTGLLDSRGVMLLRITVPIKVAMGFEFPAKDEEPDVVETILPEDYLSVSDIGIGTAWIDYRDVEPEAEPTIEEIVRAALEHADGDPELAKAMLLEHGIEAEFTIEPKPEEGDAG